MGKNKKYKRLANKVIGNCHNNDVCTFEGCKYYNICEYLMWDLDFPAPMYTHIKDVREGLKGGKYNERSNNNK